LQKSRERSCPSEGGITWRELVFLAGENFGKENSVKLAVGIAATCRRCCIFVQAAGGVSSFCLACAKNVQRGPAFGTAPDGSDWGSHGPALLETFPAVHRSPLGRLEGNRGFLPALRAGGTRFGSLVIPRGRRSAALGLARLAPFGLVLEALVGEKHLFAAGEDEFSAALDAF
jgi:hypothetical protein